MAGWTPEQLKQIGESVRAHMPERRWQHTLGVVAESKRLAARYGADENQAELAALLHDVAKFWPIEQQREWIVAHKLQADVLEYEKELWHAPVGAEFARQKFRVADELVLDAIRYHTSGRERMTKLDKIVCLADYIEPGRDFPGVADIRELADQSLERALVRGFDSTIRFLIEKEKRIYPLTLAARNGLLQELQGNK